MEIHLDLKLVDLGINRRFCHHHVYVAALLLGIWKTPTTMIQLSINLTVQG